LLKTNPQHQTPHPFKVILSPLVVTGLGADPIRKCFPGFRRTPIEIWAAEKVFLGYMAPPCWENSQAKWKSWGRIIVFRNQQLDVGTSVHWDVLVYLRYHLKRADGTQSLWENWDLLDRQLEPGRVPWHTSNSLVLPYADISVDPTDCAAQGV